MIELAWRSGNHEVMTQKIWCEEETDESRRPRAQRFRPITSTNCTTGTVAKYSLQSTGVLEYCRCTVQYKLKNRAKEQELALTRSSVELIHCYVPCAAPHLRITVTTVIRFLHSCTTNTPARLPSWPLLHRKVSLMTTCSRFWSLVTLQQERYVVVASRLWADAVVHAQQFCREGVYSVDRVMLFLILQIPWICTARTVPILGLTLLHRFIYLHRPMWPATSASTGSHQCSWGSRTIPSMSTFNRRLGSISR